MPPGIGPQPVQHPVIIVIRIAGHIPSEGGQGFAHSQVFEQVEIGFVIQRVVAAP